MVNKLLSYFKLLNTFGKKNYLFKNLATVLFIH